MVLKYEKYDASWSGLIMAFKSIGLSNRELARRLGVSEGTIRYRMKKLAEKKTDGRKTRYSAVCGYEEIIEGWIQSQRGKTHSKTLKSLYMMLKEFHKYELSYDALRRYVRKRYPEYKNSRRYIRVITPPGVLGQTDWKEEVEVQMLRPGRWVKMNFFVLSSRFSTYPLVVASERKDQANYENCHERVFKRAGGLFEYLRPDCVPTAVVTWRNGKAVINESYENYLKKLNIKLVPSRPRMPTDKGGVEKRIQDIFNRVDFSQIVFGDILELESWLEEQIRELAKEWRCSATGLSVLESFEYEKKYLRELPEDFPQVVVKERRGKVRNDGTVWFMGNYYQVPQELTGKAVLCMHTGDEIVIYHEGREIVRKPYLPLAKGMVFLDEGSIEESQTKLSGYVKSWALEAASRQIEYYEEILQGAGK